MLNIDKIQELTEDEIQYLKDLVETEGADSWKTDGLAKEIRHKLSEFTLNNQRALCAYCELRLRDGGIQLEHFIPKARYPQFTYEPRNIFSCCSSCNSPKVKKSKDIVVEPYNKGVYEANVFKIVHPYFHNPDDHIKYRDEKRIVFAMKQCTDLGRQTIKFFKWNSRSSIEDRIDRSKQRKYSDKQIARLIQQIVLYK